MTRTFTSKWTLLFLIFTVLSCKDTKKNTTVTLNATPTKPNVIIVLTDDQGYGDLGYHGNPIVKTPNLDAFAAESLELTNFHVGTTCAPTRAGLMTGRNANRNNAWHTIAGCSILLEEEETIAQVFERNGYRTGMIGKWHLGDNYPFRPHDRGFQNTFYHGGGGVQQTPDFWNNDYFDDTYFRNGVPEKTSGYCTDVWFDNASQYIDAKKEEPFFLYLALNAAHGPFNVPEKYAEIYKDSPLTEVQKRFYGMITNIDDNFGKLVEHLKKTGQFDNTILIFSADNGTARGIHYLKEEEKELGYNAGLRGIKGSHYDGGHRVPFFISWPNGNILRKTSLSELTAHVDILPTLAELTGIDYQPKKPLDGQSVAKILAGKEKTIDRMLITDTQRNQLPVKGRNSAVMSNVWRLVDGKELYNFKEDPGQQNDVAAQNPEVIAKMQKFYDDWWAGIETDIRYAEIPVGHDNANPVLITIHDMHTEDNLPWNQVQIRQGKTNPDGFYSIKVVDDGNYQFKLYRYPPESKLTMDASAEKRTGTAFVDELPQGVLITPLKAIVEVGDNSMEATKVETANFIMVQGTLKKGSYQLKSNFITKDGVKIPSYYTEVKKL
ncbi:arylsulfatase [Maribacter halichondriae]|uniref:arylsulfatase n=1 Tax=Maribacter halichondriae TaxID=2980554 RepID=UPI002359EAE5|nr:arylsulfatase [Maribacter sp. Hal144]